MPRELTLLATGDIFVGMPGDHPRIHNVVPMPGKPDLIDWFGDLVPILREGDFTFGNLEGPICTGGEPDIGKAGTGGAVFKMPPLSAQVMKRAGIDALALANNHTMDLSAGGLLEPKADWTEAATRHFKAALVERKKSFGAATVELTERDQDEVAEINALHAAVARSIAAHHFGLGFLRLPTKDDKLDWSMGEAVRIIKDKTGANYALFTWMRDSYASSERIAATVLLALLGVGLAPGGAQIGYASLVDLNTGQVLWFNHLMRGMGDLREADKAKETLEALLAQFPALK